MPKGAKLFVFPDLKITIFALDDSLWLTLIIGQKIIGQKISFKKVLDFQ